MLRAMPLLSAEERTRLGLRAAGGHMYQQDKIWSRYSNDKVDIARTLARVLRTLSKALPLDQPLTALSIGSSNEPQFRILESAFRGGLYLLDIEDAALAVVEERIRRQNTPHVRVIRGDYREVFRDAEAVLCFRDEHLGGRRMTLITLHHSLYYSPRSVLARPAGEPVRAPAGDRTRPGAVRGDPRRADGEPQRRPDQHDLAVQPLRRPVLRPPQRPGSAGVRRGTERRPALCRRAGAEQVEPGRVLRGRLRAVHGGGVDDPAAPERPPVQRGAAARGDRVGVREPVEPRPAAGAGSGPPGDLSR